MGIRVPACEADTNARAGVGRPIISDGRPPGEEPHAPTRTRLTWISMGSRSCSTGVPVASCRRRWVDLTQAPPAIVREGAGDVEEFR